MSNEKKNPLIGAFRAPPVGTPPFLTQPAKQPETPKNVKAAAAPLAAPILTKPEEAKKPAEPTKDDKAVKDGKPAAAAPAPAKPEEAKKPAEPAKDDKTVKDGKPAAAAPAPAKLEESKKIVEPAKDDKTVKEGKPAAVAPTTTKPEEGKKTAEPAKNDEAVKDGKPAAAAPAPTKPEESKKPAEPVKVDEVKEPVGQETPTASATRTADGPKGSAVTKVFEDRLDAPTEADLFKLPTPSEGEIYSMAVHPAYLKDFLDHPFTVNRETQDYKDLFESIKNYGIREPVLCRPGRNGGLEIISGHRRHDIAAQLNYPIPVLIERVDEDDAQIQCVDGNLHRKDIPLSELARAAQMKMDALKRKAGRRSKADILAGKEPMKRSDEQVGEDLGMSRASVRRRREPSGYEVGTDDEHL